MKSCEGIGKSIEKAIDNALEQLNAKREDVDIKILEEGGLFKKAKVLVTISEDCEEEYEKRAKEIEEVEDEILDVKSFFKDVETLIKNEEKDVKKEEKQEQKEEKKQLKEEKKANKKENKLSGVDFIKGLLDVISPNYNLFFEEDEEKIFVKVEGGNTGDLIGYRGECLNAIQYVASVVKNEFSGKRKRFILDIENYRGKREETLKSLAHRMETRVEKSKKALKLEPMSANERRIIHTELQKSESVTTTSKGTEPNRYVVILPKDSAENEE